MIKIKYECPCCGWTGHDPDKELLIPGPGYFYLCPKCDIYKPFRVLIFGEEIKYVTKSGG